MKAYRSGSPTANQRAQAVDRLTFLYLRRSEAGRDRRTRAAIKSSYLTQLALILFALLVGLGAAAAPPERDVLWRSLLLAACAGALGSTLSGIFKVRDQLIRLDELRSFAPAMRVQPLVGACAGIILLLVLNSKAVSLGTAEGEAWSRLGLLAFAVGFSEPFFLGLVQRIAVVPTRESAGASRTTPGQR